MKKKAEDQGKRWAEKLKKKAGDQDQHTCYATYMCNLLDKRRTVIVKRGRYGKKGDHLCIQTRKLIEKEDFIEGEVRNSSFRHKRKLVSYLCISADTAYALCLLLARILGLELDGLLKDNEMRRILKEDVNISKFQNERKKNSRRAGKT